MVAKLVSERFGTRGSSVLVKKNGATATIYSTAGGAAQANPVTVIANGFVIFYADPGTYELVESGNGTAREFLTVAADSTPASTGPLSSAWTPGRYYDGNSAGLNASAVAMSTGQIYFLRHHLPVDRVVDRVGISVGTAGAGTVKFALYADTLGLPGARVADWTSAGEPDTGTTGGKEAILPAPYTIPAGTYWLAAAFSGAPSVVIPDFSVAGAGFPILGTTRQITRAYQFASYASGFPATAAATVDANSSVPSIRLRAA